MNMSLAAWAAIREGLRAPCAALLLTLAAALPAQALVMELSEVDSVGNPPDPYSGSLYGAVPYRFAIGTYPVTAAQYVEFLNAKDPDGTNTLRLYAPEMSHGTYGQVRFNAGNAAGAKYAVLSGRGKWPVTSISFNNAMRFANWLHNGQANGDTEDGAYTLGALNASAVPLLPPATHNAGARYWIPTENEWYKAAYHKRNDLEPGGYHEYPTGSSLIPTASLPSALPNSANFVRVGGSAVGSGPGVPTDVGAYSGTRSPYGAYDMGGNVFQWTEAQFGSNRGVRGGSYAGTELDMIATARWSYYSDGILGRNAGFRVASSLPGVVYAPSTPPPPTGSSNTLEVKTAGGKALVTSGDGAIQCGKTCSASTAAGTVVTLTATPDPGFRFVAWSGACTVTSPSCVVQVFGRTQVQVNLTK